jgi:hypothetical protein
LTDRVDNIDEHMKLQDARVVPPYRPDRT